MFGLITRSVVPLAAAALSSSIVTGPEAATPNPGGVTDVESAADSTASSGPVAGAQTCSATVDPAEGSTTLTTLEGDEAEILTDAALADLSGGEVQLHDAESALETVDAAVNTVDAEGETFRSVTIPVGGDYIEPSNVTVIYDEAGDVASHSESLIRKQPSGDVHVTSYTDGQLSVDKTIDSETLAAADHPARQAGNASTDPSGVQSAFQDSSVTQGESSADVGVYGGGSEVSQAGVGSTVACITAVLGVGGGTAYLIATMCAGACVTSATGFSAAVCAACIGGYATIGGASVTAVASCF